MDKKIMLENLVREAHEKGLFNGTWLYARRSRLASEIISGCTAVTVKVPSVSVPVLSKTTVLT